MRNAFFLKQIVTSVPLFIDLLLLPQELLLKHFVMRSCMCNNVFQQAHFQRFNRFIISKQISDLNHPVNQRNNRNPSFSIMEKLKTASYDGSSFSETELCKEYKKFIDFPTIFEEHGVIVYDRASQNLGQVIKDQISQLNMEEPFLVCDAGVLLHQYDLISKSFPRGEPFYRVEYSSFPLFLRILSHLNCGFACTNQDEISTVLNLDIESKRIYYFNPIKDPHYLKFANTKSVDLLNFDCENELLKIKLYHSHGECILRVNLEESSSLTLAHVKYGCSPEEAPSLIEKSKLFDVKVKGIGFQASGKQEFFEGLGQLINMTYMAQDKGVQLSILDLGEDLGFTGQDDDLEEVLETTNSKVILDADADYRIIFEVSKNMLRKSAYLVFNIRGKRTRKKEDAVNIEYYLDGTVFEALKESIQYSKIQILDLKDPKLYPTLFCNADSNNKESLSFEAFPELETGNWCFFEYCGCSNFSISINTFSFNQV